MLYRNTSDHEPYLLHIPGCDSVACDLDQFNNIVKPILLANWYEECHKVVNNWLIHFSKLLSLLLLLLFLLYIDTHRYKTIQTTYKHKWS